MPLHTFLGSADQPLARFSQTEGTVLGRSINSKLSTGTKSADFYFKHDIVSRFFDSISASLTGLNHIGIGYACPDPTEEIKAYALDRTGTEYHVYEEDSGLSSPRWLFLGNAQTPGASLFEIVLAKSSHIADTTWYPHFQIDLDTTMSPADLAKICRQTFGQDSITWKLHIPGHGTVAYMLRISRLDGVNAYLGLGTNLRDTAYHRKYELRLIE